MYDNYKITYHDLLILVFQRLLVPVIAFKWMKISIELDRNVNFVYLMYMIFCMGNNKLNNGGV